VNKPKNTSEQEKTALHDKRNVGRLVIRLPDLIHVDSVFWDSKHAVKGWTYPTSYHLKKPLSIDRQIFLYKRLRLFKRTYVSPCIWHCILEILQEREGYTSEIQFQC
jgi:hypothetical protein